MNQSSFFSTQLNGFKYVGRGFIPQQKCRQYILDPQLTGQPKSVSQISTTTLAMYKKTAAFNLKFITESEATQAQFTP